MKADDVFSAIYGEEPEVLPFEGHFTSIEAEDKFLGHLYREFGDWKETYDSAVKGAEGLIETLDDKYGSAFSASPTSRWFALVVLSSVFLGGTLFAQKRKDQVR